MGIYIHVKTQGRYRVLHVGYYEDRPTVRCVIYAGADHKVWVREYNEFLDGRFVHESGSVIE